MATQYQEGQRLQGSDGNVYVVRNGVPVLDQSAPGGFVVKFADPGRPYEAPQAAATLAKTQIDATTTAATAPAVIAKAQADAAAAQAELETKRLGLTPEAKGKAKQDIATAASLRRMIGDIERAFRAGPGRTSGIGGILDLLPTEANSNFNAAGQAVRGQVGNALGFTGGQLNSVAEAEMAVGPYLPTASDYDSTILQKIDRLKALANDSETRGRSALGMPGGIPAVPTPNGAGGNVGDGAAPGNAPGGYGLATGGTRDVRDAGRVAAVNVLQRLLRSGAPDDEVMAAATALNASPASLSAVLEFRRKNPGYKGSYDLGDLEVRKEANSFFGQAAASPLGTGVTTAIDAAIPLGLLTGEQGRANLEAMRETNPQAAFLGSMIGGVPAAAGMEIGLTRAGLSRLAAARLGDAIYGGVQRANQSGNAADAGFGALAGLTGGVIGRGVGRSVGGVIGGVRSGPQRYLADRSVPLTVGQTVGNSGLVGRAVRSVEDRLSGIPVIGDIINARRREGVQAFNRAAFDEALAPINATTNGTIGAEGVDVARRARSQAYSDALDPVNLQLDPQFATDATVAANRVSRLPADMAARGQYALDRAGELVDPAGAVTGRSAQQMIRRFRRTANENANLPNGYDLGDAMRQAEGAIGGVMQRQAPDAYDGYLAANAANRGVEVIRDAVNAARNGTRSHQTDVFMPSQLSDAAARNAKRFGGTQGTTEQPFYDLTRAGQDVLPSSVPDSGTAGRLLTALALPASLGGAGAGIGYVGGDVEEGTKSGLALGGLLALGGSRPAQQALTAALLRRPNAARNIGRLIYDRSVYAGALGAPGGIALLNYMSR